VAQQLADRHLRAIGALELGQKLDHRRLEREPPGGHLTHGEDAGDGCLRDGRDVEQRVAKDRKMARDALARAESFVEHGGSPRHHQQHDSWNCSVVRCGRTKLVDGLESELHRDATALYSG
jgi:hypothetical protein